MDDGWGWGHEVDDAHRFLEFSKKTDHDRRVGPVSLADVFQDLSASSILAGVGIFFAIAIFLFLPPDHARFENRANKILKANGSSGHGINKTLFQRALQQIIGQLPFDIVKQKIIDWFVNQTLIGAKHRVVMTQAGLRLPQAMFYFEIIRVLVGLLFAALAFFIFGLYQRGQTDILLIAAFTFLGLMIGLYIPNVYLKRRIKKRKEKFDKYWDDAIGLLIICLDAGLSIEVALRRIARELALTAPVLAEELVITVTELTLLKERRLAYTRLSQRMDLPSVKSVTIALIQAEKQGASISQSLRVISQTNRQTRISHAEEKAAALGPKMTLPMVIFFLPVIFVIILAPIILTADFI